MKVMILAVMIVFVSSFVIHSESWAQSDLESALNSAIEKSDEDSQESTAEIRREEEARVAQWNEVNQQVITVDATSMVEESRENLPALRPNLDPKERHSIRAEAHLKQELSDI